MKKTSVLLLSIVFFGVVLNFSGGASGSENGSFGSYLVGTVDLREGHYTIFQIVNPTVNKVKIVIGIFSPTGAPVGCLKGDLPPNGMYETIINAQVAETKPLTGNGIVKIVAVDPERGEKIVEGITGFQKHFYKSGHIFWGSDRVSESNLPAIPQAILTQGDEPELKKILQSCHE